MKRWYERTSVNLLFNALVAVGAFVWFIATDALTALGLAGVATLWQPILIGIATAIVFFFVQMFTRKFAWIVTLLGVGLNVYLTLGWFL